MWLSWLSLVFRELLSDSLLVWSDVIKLIKSLGLGCGFKQTEYVFTLSSKFAPGAYAIDKMHFVDMQ